MDAIDVFVVNLLMTERRREAGLRCLEPHHVEALDNPFEGLSCSLLTFPSCGHTVRRLRPASVVLTRPLSQADVHHAPFVSLSLPPLRSLEQCLRLYTTIERLPDVICDQCSRLNGVVVKRDAHKRLLLSRLPTLLCLHIARLNGGVDKVESHVAFPLRLDVSSFTDAGRASPPLYQLASVVLHHGSACGGHFTTLRRSGGGGQWLHVSDDVVTPVTTPQVERSQAYMLIYDVVSDSGSKDI